jgi:epidermal growth factor receptor substrate 15
MSTAGTDGVGGEPPAAAADALGVEDVKAPPAPAEMSSAGNSDPFGTLDQAKAKADFENAFASFTKAHNKNAERAATETKLSNFNAEFPPISELEGDESDSDSDQGGGFDDDFTSSSPKGKNRQSVEAAKDSTAFPMLPTLASETAGTGLASQPPNKR